MQGQPDNYIYREDSMQLTIHVQKRELGGYQVRPEGRLDAVTTVDFDEKIENLLDEKPVVLVLDMTDLAYVSSAGLRVIYKAWKTVGEYKGKFLMVNLQPQIKMVMEIIKSLPSEQVFTSVEEVDEGIKVTFEGENVKEPVQVFDKVLMSIGRKPVTKGLGIDEVRIAYVLNSKDMERAMYLLRRALEQYNS